MAESECSALFPGERKMLASCEKVIEKHIDSVSELGRALASIRNGQLFRDEFPSFEAYCQTRWASLIIMAESIPKATGPTMA